MKLHRWCISLAFALFSAIVSAADCTPLDAVGKIDDIFKDEANGSAFVIRAACFANEPRTAAKVYQRLYQGDRIEITGATKVYVTLAQEEERIFTHETNHQPLYGKTIKNIDKSRYSWTSIMASISNALDLIGRSRMPVPVNSSVRGVGFLENVPLLPSGLQYLPIDYDQVAILWQGSSTNIAITTSKETTEIKPEKHSRTCAFIPITTNQLAIKINSKERNIGWSIHFSSATPLPSGMDEPDPASATARMTRALWILKDGPVEWRMFALSEIASLSEEGVFAAEELWDAACSGELADTFGIK